MAQVRLIKISNSSDGNANHTARPETHRRSDLSNYLEKLGTLWMKERGEAQPGVVYRIDRLPDGYSVWERPRPSDPSHVDKWCYGHPSGKTFDSPNRFFPHFLSLMEDGNARSCICVNCGVKKRGPGTQTQTPRSANDRVPGQPHDLSITSLPSQPQVRPGKPPQVSQSHESSVAPELKTGLYKAKGRQWVEGRTDEEGTPDPYRNNIDRLKSAGVLDTIIEEKMSADWRAEKASGVTKYFGTLKQMPAWQPRLMEIVLFVRAIEPDEQLLYHPAGCKFMIMTNNNELKKPLWEAGLVTQTAIQTDVPSSISIEGYRVEPLSNANDKNGKGIWKQYTYVRPDQMRPFSFWQRLLCGDADKHETVENAMLVMSTITLIKRYRFKGVWPEAKVYCHGLYLGPELIIEGDFVYLLPEGHDDGVKDIMQVNAITLDLWNLDKASVDDHDDGHPYNSAARVTGKVYTIAKDRTFENEPVDIGLNGQWYPRTSADKLSRVPFHRIMGRCYNSHILQQWLQGDASVSGTISPGISMAGVVEGRAFSSARYRRIDEDRSWFWADTRVEALDLEEVNNVLVSTHDISRDPKKYRKEIRVIEGMARPEERRSLQQQDDRERRSLLRGGNSMLASALEMEAVEDSNEVSQEGKRATSPSDEEEDQDEGAARNDFVNDMAKGLAMSDEEVLSGSGDDELSLNRAGTSIKLGTPRLTPMIIIND